MKSSARPTSEMLLLTAADVQQRTKLSRSSAYALMKRLPGHVRIGRALRLPVADLERFIAMGGDRQSPSLPDTMESSPRRANQQERAGRDARNRRTEYWRNRLI